jgi:ankyrin repeat protein
LRWSAENGQLETVKYLIEQGANIHANNDWALRWSARYGQLEIIKYLVEQGADIHADDDEALRESAENGQLETVKYLIEQGADSSLITNKRIRKQLGLDIQQLPKSKCGSDKVNEKCPICLSEFELDDTICNLKCNHIFHDNCIESWIEKVECCPMCRREII